LLILKSYAVFLYSIFGFLFFNLYCHYYYYYHHYMTTCAVLCRNVNGGSYGELLAGHECIVGRYPVTESLLNLLSSVISRVC